MPRPELPTPAQRGRSFQEMHNMISSGDFRDRAAMCIRWQARYQVMSDTAEIKALASGVISNNGMDLESMIQAVATDPDAAAASEDDEALSQIVENLWPIVAQARYPQLTGVIVNYPPEVMVDPISGKIMEIPVGLAPTRVGQVQDIPAQPDVVGPEGMPDDLSQQGIAQTPNDPPATLEPQAVTGPPGGPKPEQKRGL